MSDVNIVILSGKIHKKYDVETKNEKPTLNASLKQDRGGDRKGYETLSAWGKFAVDQLDLAEEGDSVIVQGSLGGYKGKDDVWKTTVNVERVKVNGASGMNDDDAGFDKVDEECPV